jgi:ribonuclease HI
MDNTTCKTNYYAVKKGIQPGIYLSWEECKKNVNGVFGAIYKKFDNLIEATEFINDIKKDIKKAKNTKINQSENDNKNTNQNNDNELLKNYTYIFCDGSAIHQNYVSIRCGFGLCMIKSDGNEEKYHQIINNHGTNNVAELNAILYGLKLVKEKKIQKTCFVCDSKYAINCILVWSKQWKINNWMTSSKKPVENLDLIKLILHEYESSLNEGYHIVFKHVNSHKSKPRDATSFEYFLWYGNDVADQLAKDGCQKIQHESPQIFKGTNY